MLPSEIQNESEIDMVNVASKTVLKLNHNMLFFRFTGQGVTLGSSGDSGGMSLLERLEQNSHLTLEIKFCPKLLKRCL